MFDNTRNSSLNCDYVGNFGGGLCSDRDPTPNDPSDSHGTMVSGIIGAVANNNIGVRSLASGSQLGGHNYLLNQYNPNYLTVIKNIDAIHYEKSISMFHDLNDLIIVFYEKSKEMVKKNTNNNNNTKKIYLRLNTNKKTIKNRYKD